MFWLVMGWVCTGGFRAMNCTEISVRDEPRLPSQTACQARADLIASHTVTYRHLRCSGPYSAREVSRETAKVSP